MAKRKFKQAADCLIKHGLRPTAEWDRGAPRIEVDGLITWLYIYGDIHLSHDDETANLLLEALRAKGFDLVPPADLPLYLRPDVGRPAILQAEFPGHADDEMHGRLDDAFYFWSYAGGYVMDAVYDNGTLPKRANQIIPMRAAYERLVKGRLAKALAGDPVAEACVADPDGFNKFMQYLVGGHSALFFTYVSESGELYAVHCTLQDHEWADYRAFIKEAEAGEYDFLPDEKSLDWREGLISDAEYEEYLGE